MKKLFLIDGMALIFRSYYAFIHNPLLTSKGFPTSAIYGFFTSILKILSEEKPDYISIALDSKKPTFRHEMFPAYKANRTKMPDDLGEQIPEIINMISKTGINLLINEGYEADDIIATVVDKLKKDSDLSIYIVTGDKDIMQLVNDRVFIYNPGNKFSGPIIYDEKKVYEKWNVPPEKICDLLSIMGDSSDNIPGVKGVGPKTASKLINDFNSVSNLIENVDSISNDRIKNLVINQINDIRIANQLVKLDYNVPVDVDINQMNINNVDFSNAGEDFMHYEMSSILESNNIKINAVDSIGNINKNYMLISNKDQFKNFKKKITKVSLVSFDLETTDINPLKADIVGFSFSFNQNEGYYIPILFPGNIEGYDLNKDEVLSELKDILESSSISFIGQNIKYDCIILSRLGINVLNISFDTMIAAHLINPMKSAYKLDDLSIEYLNYQKIDIESLIGYKGNQISMSEVEVNKIRDYACEDADVALKLYFKLEKILEQKKLSKVFYDLEIPFIKVLVNLEKNGLFVNLEILKSLSMKISQEIKELSSDIYKKSGKEFNINSPQQLAGILFDDLKLKQVKKRSTSVEVLEFLKKDHPLPEIILQYRHLNKLKNTYLDGIPKFLNLNTNRIHTSFNQTVASTGRLSSTKPNFQNIPIRTDIGKQMRKAFQVQNSGWKLISADYSQIELRIMAHFSKEPALISSFKNDEDVHSRTASLVYGIDIESVSVEQRRQAKIVNYGIMYGAGPFRMSRELNISMKKAKEIIVNYFNTYKMVKEFIDKTLLDAQKRGYVETYFGRRRDTINLSSSNINIVNAEKRAAINMPIQGTASELIKAAMINLKKSIDDKDLQSKMVLQVHDELLFEVPEEEEEIMLELIREKMENSIKLDIPIKIDCKSGFNWYEIH